MRVGRSIVFGVLGAGAISVLSVVLRALGLPIRMELILGSMSGQIASPYTFAVGLAIHLAIGAFFGLVYGKLFESVWQHGGASTGLILGFLHATLIGMFFGLTPMFHPHVPWSIPDPGAYFSNGGVLSVFAFFGLHLVYGAIVGGGYGHVASEHEWAPAGRL